MKLVLLDEQLTKFEGALRGVVRKGVATSQMNLRLE